MAATTTANATGTTLLLLLLLLLLLILVLARLLLLILLVLLLLLLILLLLLLLLLVFLLLIQNIVITLIKTLKLNSLQGHPISVMVIHDWEEEKMDNSFPDAELMWRHVHALNKYQQQSGDGKICVMDKYVCKLIVHICSKKEAFFIRKFCVTEHILKLHFKSNGNICLITES